MQVAESYLVARLAPGLFPWMVERNAYADENLFQAIDLLQNHTQVNTEGCRRKCRPMFASSSHYDVHKEYLHLIGVFHLVISLPPTCKSAVRFFIACRLPELVLRGPGAFVCVLLALIGQYPSFQQHGRRNLPLEILVFWNEIRGACLSTMESVG